MALALSPARIKENREVLKKMDFDKIKTVVRESLERNGFEVDSFKNVFDLLDRLQSEQSADRSAGLVKAISAEVQLVVSD